MSTAAKAATAKFQRPFIAVLVLIITGFAGVAGAQVTLTDIGPANPTPGPNDISQLSTNGNTAATTSTGKPDGLNYYADNSAPPGQTFTTGADSANLVALAVRTAGLDDGGGYGTPATIANYYLRHLLGVRQHAVHLIQSYTNLIPGFTDGRMVEMERICRVSLAANSTYAYSISDLPGG